MKNFPKSILVLLPLFFLHTRAIKFDIQNKCPYTVWPAAVHGGGDAVPGGGQRLDPGQTWTVGLPGVPKLAKIWARTNCTFDSSGRGRCLTGDCNGQLECKDYGAPPHTLAEYGLNTFGRKDYYDISVLKGFNVPIEFTPTTNGCTRPIRCAADITGQCPKELKAPGGCHNPCTVYNTTQYCCHSQPCRPTNFSRFFKSRCRDVFSYPEDDPTSTFTCPPGTSYRVVFCP